MVGLPLGIADVGLIVWLPLRIAGAEFMAGLSLRIAGGDIPDRPLVSGDA